LPAPATDPSWLRPEMQRLQNAKNLCGQMWICEPPALSRALAEEVTLMRDGMVVVASYPSMVSFM